MIHMLVLAFLLAFLPREDVAEFSHAEPWHLKAALFLWDDPRTILALPLATDLIAAYGFFAARVGRPHRLSLLIYTCVQLLGGAVGFAAATYLASLEAVTLPDPHRPHDGWVTSFYGAETIWITAIRQSVLSIPLAFVLMCLLVERWTARSSPAGRQ